MSRQLNTEAVAESMVSDGNAPRFITEKVRFWFHSVAISLCGILAVLIPWLFPWPTEMEWWIFAGREFGHVQLIGGLLILSIALFAWYEFIRQRPRLKDFLVTWPLRFFTAWMTWVANRVKVRPHELKTRASAMDFLAGLGLAWALTSPGAVAIACLAAAWCDPFARVIGKRYGRRRWWSTNKTVVGSLACFLVAALMAGLGFAVIYGFEVRMLSACIVVGLTAACLELIPQWVFPTKKGAVLTPADNFSIMLGSALVAHAFTPPHWLF